MKALPAVFQFSWILGGVLGLSFCSFAMDPFYPPAEWEAFQKRIIEAREHEASWEARPLPGTSPVVALQTVIIAEFSVDKATVAEAFSDFTHHCKKLNVPLTFYLDAELVRSNASITYSARNETAQKVLSMLLGISGASLRINGKDLLVGHYGTWGLDPYATGLKTWILSEELHLRLFPHALDKTNVVPSSWISADQALKKQGVPFPPGTYADYRPDVHVLVVINRIETSSSLAEWIHEAESEFVIQRARAKGRMQMDGYELETKAFPLKERQVKAVRSRLVSKGKLAPFATSSQGILRNYGVIDPTGSAAWLDEKNAELWILNTPDQITACSASLSEWLDNMIEKAHRPTF